MSESTDGLSARDLINRAKMRYMQSERADWSAVDDGLVSQWYFVSKIMGSIIGPGFPYNTFVGLWDEIRKDPNYKKKDE